MSVYILIATGSLRFNSSHNTQMKHRTAHCLGTPESKYCFTEKIKQFFQTTERIFKSRFFLELNFRKKDWHAWVAKRKEKKYRVMVIGQICIQFPTLSSFLWDWENDCKIYLYLGGPVDHGLYLTRMQVPVHFYLPLFLLEGGKKHQLKH